MINNLERLDLNKIVLDEIKQIEDTLIEINTEGQLFSKGVNNDNVELSSFKPYTPFTIQKKKERGQPTNRVTLKDTGDFYKGFKVNILSDSFELTSTDEKTKELKDKYGKRIFGITDQNLVGVKNVFIEDRVSKEIRKALLI